MAVGEDGRAVRPELTIALDVATWSVVAAVLREESTRAVDAALLSPRWPCPIPPGPAGPAICAWPTPPSPTPGCWPWTSGLQPLHPATARRGG
ncbi:MULTISPECIES: hypothetical protein [Streptomyces]|uniref:hypothetical protein n=1 Tax=Streptomyces TaxID=1883 RepID=UPI0018E54F2A|nr:hypothetical protein GCM10010207_88090 [Streptomyces atratus]